MAINLYPMTKTELHVEDYEVKINGKQVELDTARVSAVPFNRRWPGHQRGLEQTELINFLSFAMDEEVFFEIKPKQSFDKVAIRPQSLGIDPTITEDGTICFTLKEPAYFTVEPYERHRALHIFADPISDYQVDFQDKNVIYFGAGEHHVGDIVLESNQTLFLDEGAVVYACVKAIDAENIKILGRGILDNSENKEQILFEMSAEHNEMAIENAIREHTIQLEYCTNIEIDGITIRNSLVYNIRPIGCENLSIKHVKIIGCWRYNSDGIDMHNCANVLIDSCFIRTFDDAICVKGFDCFYEGDVEQAVHEAMYRNGKAYDIFKQVRVRNCTIWNDWGKSLEIGAETRAEEIYDIAYENCDIIHVLFSPIDCYNVDYADVHDVSYENIRIEYDDFIPSPEMQTSDEDVYICSNPQFSPQMISVTIDWHPEYSAGGARRGRCRNLTYKNIYLYGKYAPRIGFAGYDEEHRVENVVVDNVYWNGEVVTEFTEDTFALVRYTDNICYKTSALTEK